MNNNDLHILTHLYAFTGMWMMLTNGTQEDFKDNLKLHQDCLTHIIKELYGYSGTNSEILTGIQQVRLNVLKLESFLPDISSIT